MDTILPEPSILPSFGSLQSPSDPFDLSNYALDSFTLPDFTDDRFNDSQFIEPVDAAQHLWSTPGFGNILSLIMRDSPRTTEPKKSKRVFSPETLTILQKWISDKGPYVSKRDLPTLASHAGVTAKQVRTYLSNYRQRYMSQAQRQRYLLHCRE